MTLVVPFDGRTLSKVALLRAVQFDSVFATGITAVTVIPQNNTDYARARGWLGPTASFDTEAIVEHLTATITEIAPNATVEQIFVGRDAPSGTIGNRLRRFARDVEASIVFVGSENAGRLVSTLSVGSAVSSERSYDTMIISHVGPSKIEELERVRPTSDAVE